MAERDLGRARFPSRCDTARRGAAARTASTASGRRRGCPRSVSPMPVCSMRYSQPRASQVLAMSSCLYSLYPESTLTATSENLIGARCRRTSRICSSAQLSLPPDSPTMTRSPSSIMLIVDDRLGRLLGEARLELAAVCHGHLDLYTRGRRPRARDADGDRRRRHVLPHDGSGADDRVLADRDAVENLRARANPGAVANRSRRPSVRDCSSTGFDGSEKSWSPPMT